MRCSLTAVNATVLLNLLNDNVFESCKPSVEPSHQLSELLQVSPLSSQVLPHALELEYDEIQHLAVVQLMRARELCRQRVRVELRRRLGTAFGHCRWRASCRWLRRPRSRSARRSRLL